MNYYVVICKKEGGIVDKSADWGSSNMVERVSDCVVGMFATCNAVWGSDMGDELEWWGFVKSALCGNRWMDATWWGLG